jgi:transforming growth factor-beta-induced protein
MKFFHKFLGFAAVALALSACGDEEPNVQVGPVPTYNMVQALQQDANFAMLVEAVKHAGLADALAGSQNITVFAPTNEAFARLLGQLGVSKVTDVDAATLAEILKYHVVPSVVSGSAAGGGYTTLEGKSLYVTTAAPVKNLNGKAEIVVADRVATNGVFHGISSVLEIPSGLNIAATLSAMGGYDSLLIAAERAGLAGALTGSSELTVLAPNNAAFEGIPVSSLAPATLDRVLRFHIFAGRLYTQEFDIAAKTKPSLLGALVADNEQEVILDAPGVFQRVASSMPNITATNGVIHAMPSVIEPDPTANEAFSPNIFVSSVDARGIDQFGAVVAQSGVAIFNILANQYVVHARLDGPSAFDTPEAAANYVNTYTFAGSTPYFSSASGSKITSLNGSQFFVTKNSAGTYLNGVGRNAFGAGSTTTINTFNTRFVIVNSIVAPLPADKLPAILESNGFTIMAAMARKAERLTGNAGMTVFAVSDEVMADFLGLTGAPDPVGIINGITSQATIDFLAEIVDRHTVPAVAFFVDVANDRPTFTNVLDEELPMIRTATGGYIIPHIPNDLGVVSTVTGVDIRANNGVIHVLDAVLDF